LSPGRLLLLLLLLLLLPLRHRDGSAFKVKVNGRPALNLACCDMLGLGDDPVVQVRGWRGGLAHARGCAAAANTVLCLFLMCTHTHALALGRPSLAGACARHCRALWRGLLRAARLLRHL
jgi:hypothetical protein